MKVEGELLNGVIRFGTHIFYTSPEYLYNFQTKSSTGYHNIVI